MRKLRVDKILITLRHLLIEILVGNMPIIMNVRINRPKGYKGMLVKFRDPEKSGIFSKNYLDAEESDTIITGR